MFAPKSVALIGGTEVAGSVGRTILENLRESAFGGTLFPVNPKRANVLGIESDAVRLAIGSEPGASRDVG